MPDTTLNLANLLLTLVALLVGGVASWVVHTAYRSFIPVINLRLEAVPSPNPRVLILSMEVENVSKVDCRKRPATSRLRIAPVNAAPKNSNAAPENSEVATRTHKDYLEVSEKNSIEVMKRTHKFEPKEIVNTQVCYEWGKESLVQCAFQVKYYRRWFRNHNDSRTIVKWFANPATLHQAD